MDEDKTTTVPVADGMAYMGFQEFMSGYAAGVRVACEIAVKEYLSLIQRMKTDNSGQGKA